MRHAYQQTMADEFKAPVERLTVRKVVAFISGNHVDPDIAVELFVLDGAAGRRLINGAAGGGPNSGAAGGD